MIGVKKRVRNFIRTIGYDISRYTPSTNSRARKEKLLQVYGIEVALDVGANIGQYAKQLRRIGYRGRIVSFEPLSAAYYQLQNSAKADGAWDTLNIALGDIGGYATINVAGNSQSSSLMRMLPLHIASAPDSQYVGTERIEIKTLDSLCDTLSFRGTNILLKIDAQGFERNIISGAQTSLNFIDTVELEMSFSQFYEGEATFDELYTLLGSRGYRAVGIDAAWTDENTGQVFQVDGIFHRF